MKSNKVYEKTRCCVCGSQEYTIVYPKIPGGDEVNPVERFKATRPKPITDQVVRCTGCGLVYMNPRPRQKIIIDGYTAGDAALFVSQTEGREITFAKELKHIMRYVKKPGKVLDVGTANASFLAVAKREGWDIEGVEPNKWLCKWAKKHYGIDVLQGTLEEQRLKEGSFDLVTLWDVLEHVPTPKDTLKECIRILKAGGYLVINYPDIGTWVARLLGKKWVFLNEVHLWYFDRNTIKQLLEQEGMEVISIKPYWQSFSLGYLAGCLGTYVSPSVEKVASKVVSTMRLKEMQIPYWVGQTFVLARKR